MEMWLLLLLFLTFFLWRYSRRPFNFPPGPKGLPLVGYAPFLGRLHKLAHRAAAILGERYGSVTGLYFGNRPVVFVSGYEACKECLKNENFDGRPFASTQRFRSFGKKLGLVFAEGDFWKEQRRFSLRHMRDFGFGRNWLEDAIHEDIIEVISEVKENMKDSLDVTKIFGVSVINILWAVMAGRRYSHKDTSLQKLLEIVQLSFRSGSLSGGIITFFPFLRFIAPKWSGFEELMRRYKAIQNFITDTIAEHKNNLNPDEEPRDFIDVYLRELSAPQGPVHSSYTEEQLIVLCMDLFSAGSETTTSFLGFTLLYMIKYPEVQLKVQEEIDSVIGRNRFPSLEDKPKLPYIEATLTELLRVTSVAPFAVPHRAMKTTNLMGYAIPKDTMLLVNLWTVHMDKDHWKDPENFRPERFLDQNGGFLKDDWVLPFGTGKRVCLGEPLARRVTFLFFTALLQTFKFSAANGDLPDVEPDGGFTVAPKSFKTKVELRQ